tara:strand:+ start:222 stop:548 length:327 start_codon:yes stop_codon:yes gene_type:complete
MKLTAKKLKELIKEELQEAFRDKYGQPKSFGMTRGRMAHDLYMRTDPNYKPTDYGDYEPDPDYDEVAAQAKALLAVIDLVPEIVTDDPAVAEKMKEMAPQHADKIKIK